MCCSYQTYIIRVNPRCYKCEVTSYYLNHPELFRYTGLFSGFVQDPLAGYSNHLTPQKLAAYKDRFKVYFRGIGDQDPYMPNFLSDDDLLTEYGIKCERHIYRGGHLWKVWQHCFHDFYQLLF